MILNSNKSFPNIWIKQPIIELPIIMPSTRLVGRTKPRVLEALPRYRDLVARLMAQKLAHLIDTSWFRVVYDGPWEENLVTDYGKEHYSIYDIGRFAYYYRYGTGTTTPTGSNVRLTEHQGFTSTCQPLPSGTVANVQDYTNGIAGITKSYLAGPFTTSMTITEGGLSSITSTSNYLNTHFLLDTPVPVSTGQYFAPLYTTGVALSPSVTESDIASPFMTGWATGAKARYESLFGCLPACNPSTGGVGGQYLDEAAADFGYTDLVVSTSASVAQHNIYGNTGGAGHGITPGHPFDSQYLWYPYCVLSTDSDDLVFNTQGHIFSDTTVKVLTPSTYMGAASGWVDYVSGSRSRIFRQVFDSANGNMTGIRSIALALMESPLGSTDWRYRSMFRVLLDSPMDKVAGKILTLDFTQNWS